MDSVTKSACIRSALAVLCAAAVFAVRPRAAHAQFPLTVSVDGSGSVRSTPSGIDCPTDCSQTYLVGTIVTLTADPDPGESFTGWSGCDVTNGDRCEVVMVGSRHVSASFTQPTESFTLTVSKNPSSGGTVASNPGGISCGTDCSEEYPSGTRVTLTAAAATGWNFTGWGGACSGTGSCTVTMSGNRNVSANFSQDAPETFTLSVSRNPASGGTVTSDPAGIDCGSDCSHDYEEGSTVTLSASAAEGWVFSGWGGACSGAGSCTVTMTSDRSVSATFTEDDPESFTLTVAVEGDGEGSVTSEPPGIECPGDCTETYTSATDVTLTAEPEPESAFLRWSGDASGDANPLQVTVNASRSIVAEFVRGLTITTTSLRDGVVGVSYADTLRASGGTSQRSWSVAGGLPPGLTLASQSGVISGFPDDSGQYAFTVRVQSDTFRAEKQLSIHVTESSEPPPEPEPPPPGLTMDETVDQLLTGSSSLTQEELSYLDDNGNRNGSFDVGDFRAYVTHFGGDGEAAAAGVAAAAILLALERRRRKKASGQGRARRARRAHLWLAVLLALVVTTCRDSVAPPDPQEPIPGQLVVEFESPNANDGAVVLFIRGTAIESATAANGSYETFMRTIDSVWRVAVVGNLTSGAVLHLEVEDVNAAVSGSVVEVASRANIPRSTSQYFVRVRPVGGS